MEQILRHTMPGNPRNSEGSFVKLSDGTLYFAYSRYCGSSASDHAAARQSKFTAEASEGIGNRKAVPFFQWDLPCFFIAA